MLRVSKTNKSVFRVKNIKIYILSKKKPTVECEPTADWFIDNSNWYRQAYKTKTDLSHDLIHENLNLMKTV